jgi:hypothetical protein
MPPPLLPPPPPPPPPLLRPSRLLLPMKLFCDLSSKLLVMVAVTNSCGILPPPPRRKSTCGWVGGATHNKTQQQGGVEPLPCLLLAANSASFRPLKNLSLASSSLFFSHSLCSTLPRPPITTYHGIQHMMVHTCMGRVKEDRRTIRCCCSSSESGAPKAFVLELAGCGARSQDDCSIMDASMEHQQMGIHTWIDGTRIPEAARFLRRRRNPT